eukprot:scaffold648318_cov55-Prasinocladus_malaysianus.AAC.1
MEEWRRDCQQHETTFTSITTCDSHKAQTCETKATEVLRMGLQKITKHVELLLIKATLQHFKAEMLARVWPLALL